MSTIADSSEEDIRKYFKDLRDRLNKTSARLETVSKIGYREDVKTLNKTSARLETVSKIGYREDVKTLFSVQSKTFDWLAGIYNDLETLFLETKRLAIDFQKHKPILEHFKEHLEKVAQEKERFR